MTCTVYVDRIAREESQLIEQMKKAIDRLNLAEDFRKARTVFIKPNLTYPRFKEGVTTRLEFVRALVAALDSIDSTTRIIIGEGEGGYNSFSMTGALTDMGFFELEKDYSQVKVVNLSKLPSTDTDIETPHGAYRIPLPSIFFEEIDFSISCPLPKVHCMTRLTLSYKNIWGCLPDTMRLKHHHRFDWIISRIAEKLKFRYAFLDGRYGLDRYGPMGGDAVEVDWFAASNSLAAFDQVLAGMMGFDWCGVGHLRAARHYGYMPEEGEIEVVGDPGSLARCFYLKREVWNYPALAAFHSKFLTQLFYFSGLAGPLHTCMYLFRKKPID